MDELKQQELLDELKEEIKLEEIVPVVESRDLLEELKQANLGSIKNKEGSTISNDSVRRIVRSNSEIYIKDTSMQDDEDLVMPPPMVIPAPILYAEATASDAPSQTVLVIDQS